MLLVLKVWLEAEGGKAFGDGIFDLLLRVRTLGSLRRAAAEIGMSYSQAWRLVRDLGMRLGCDLLAAEAGGEGGGRSVLTSEGERWVEAYGAFRREAQASVVEAFDRHCSQLIEGGYEVAEPGRRRRSTIELQATRPLVPALQSNWLFMHVSVMILSYASLLIGSVVAISYVVINNLETSSRFFNSDYKEILYFFDNLSYRSIGIGFCFLTLGILSGAVWANETWGTYWSWDPKETWALVTWLIFAIYLHTRLLYGWEGIQSARIASFGFILIWFCYLGVNLLGKGLHSYGFFT